MSKKISDELAVIDELLGFLLDDLGLGYVEISHEGARGWCVRDHTDEGLRGRGYSSSMRASFSEAYTSLAMQIKCKHKRKKLLDTMDRGSCGKTLWYRCTDCGHEWHKDVKAAKPSPKCAHSMKLMGSYEDQERRLIQWYKCSRCGAEKLVHGGRQQYPKLRKEGLWTTTN